MRYLFLILFYCEEILAGVPGWVDGLRSGEERFKLQNGDRTFFRQIGDTCDKVLNSLEKDIEREFGHLVAYTTEVVYKDEVGCATTISVSRNPQPINMGVENRLQRKALSAQKHAYYGLSRKEFIAYTKDESPIIANSEPTSPCLRAVKSTLISVHGLVHVCWKDDVIQAYCIPRAEGCWKKVP